MSNYLVLKFGGTSVANLNCWQNIHHIINNKLKKHDKVMLICSAPSQISNKLEKALKEALENNHSETLNTIQATYLELAKQLDIDESTTIHHYFNELDEKLRGIALLGETSPRVQAIVMSFGERLLSELGSRYLAKHKISNTRLDARNYLTARPKEQDPYQHYLSSTVDAGINETLINTVNNDNNRVFITQGFIASNSDNETVLLGRGGSDTSAAYFSVMLGASACEIWTDVPGIYTADPRIIPNARMLKTLDYEEAQEIAALGGKVLHPQSIQPLAQSGIPLWIRYSKQPDRAGTLIGTQTASQNMEIKALSVRKSLRLISIDTMRMWQQVGYLADIFALFKEHMLSIDLISTSESNLTVSLDDTNASRDTENIDALLKALQHYGSAKTIGPCAAISIIGRNMRSNLQKLSLVLDIFKDKPVHLLNQAANDLNLTFVVDEDDAERLMKQMHHVLIEANACEYMLAKTWAEEFGQAQTMPQSFWQDKAQEIINICADNKPHYIYDLNTVQKRAKALASLNNIDRVFYSIKANHNNDILSTITHEGLGLECVSLEELEYILKNQPQLDRNRVLFTPNFAEKHEYQRAYELGVYVTVDNLYPLEAWPEVFENRDILLRVDCAQGDGHHRYVCTAGSDSKFGIPLSEIPACLKAIKRSNTRVIGLHSHTGSGILTPGNWIANAKALSALLPQFKDVAILDLGGGLGIVEKPGQSPLDLSAVDETLAQIKSAFPELQLWLEPGRYLVADSGALVAQVTQIKNKKDHLYVGINTGMNALIRPALYGAYHHIVNLSKLNEPASMLTTIVGPICESGDVLGQARLLPLCQEGDIILIANTGAYGEVMSSSYNMRECPKAECLK